LQTYEGFGTLATRIVVSERQGEMPGPKRSRRERTDEWAKIKQWTLWVRRLGADEIPMKHGRGGESDL